MKKITILLLLCVIFTGITTNAQSVFDANFNNFSFLAGSRTQKVGTTNGSSAGDVNLYSNVITISGQQIDCIVRTVSLTGGSFALPTGITSPNIPFDVAQTSGGNLTDNQDRFFSPTFSWNAGGGNCKFRFEFILGGTYSSTTTSGTAVILQNAYVNTYDIDGNGQANANQFAEFGGYNSAQFVTATAGNITATYNSGTGLTKFRSQTNANTTNVTDDNNRIRVAYNNLSVFETSVGADGSGQAYYFLDFGSGPIWTSDPPISTAPVLSCSVVSNSTSCSSPNGSATVSVTSGGTAPFAYSWNSSPVQTTATATGLPGGTFTVFVTGADGLSSSCSSIIAPPPGPSAASISASTTTLTCTTTSITLTASATDNSGSSNLTYAWTPSGTGTTKNVTTAGTYTVTITDPDNGCTATASKVITLNNSAPTAASISASTTTLTCTTTSITLTASATDNSAPSNLTYAWSGGGTGTTKSVSAPGTYTVTITDPDNGCTATATKVITQVNSGPTNASISSSTTTLTCSTTSITLTASATDNSGSSNLTYAWTPSGTGTTKNVTTAGTYTVTITDPDNGCTATATKVITQDIAAPTSASISSATTVLTCGTTSITLTASATDNSGSSNLTYAWSGGGTGTTKSVSTPGTYTVTITDPDNGCTATATKVITQDLAAPTSASISSATTVLTCGTTSITLTASATDNSGSSNLTYAWSGGGTGTTKSVSAPGTYTVTITDSDNGCTATATKIITQNIAAPTSAIISSATTVLTCGTTSITLTASATDNSGSSNLTYAWSPSGTGTTKSVSTPGTYTVTITDPDNGCTATASKVITQDIAAPTSASISSATTILTCGTTSITLTASATDNSGSSNLTYAWSPSGTGTTKSVSTPGTYTVTITDPDNGCTATATKVITQDIAAPTSASISSATTILTCGTTSITLTASATDNSGTSNLTYAWSGGGTGTTKSVSTPGTYTVTITDPDNGCTTTATKVITQDIAAPTSASISSATTILTCGTTSITLTASATDNSGSSNLTYAWSPSGTGTTKSVSTPGTYTVTITDPDNGCTATATKVITQDIAAPTSASISSATTILTCGTTSITLTASATDNSAPSNLTYAWSGGGTGTTKSVSTPGTYTVTITDPDNGCTATATKVITQDIAAPTSASISSATTILTCGTTSITLTASATDNSAPSNIIYAWSGGGTGTTKSVSTPGTYTVTITDPDNGCTATATKVITQDIAAPTSASISSATTILTCGTTSITLTASATDNSAPSNLTYAWSGGGTGTTKSVSTPGTYTVTITDPDNGCTATATKVITQDIAAPTSASISSATTILTCGTTSITLTASATDNSGTSNLTYAWSGGGTGTTKSVSTPGTYTVTITDPDNGCTATATKVITQDIAVPTSASISSATTILTCGTTSITLTASATDNSGSSNLTYAWTPSGTGPTKSVTTAGTYTVTITDSDNGCTATASVITTLDNTLPTASISGTTAVCQNSTSPDITFTGADGTSPYTFTYNINGGTNTTVTTVSGNSVTVSVPTGTVGSFAYNLVNVSDANSCSQSQTGTATVTVNSLPTFSQCPTNIVQITDANSCSSVVSYTATASGTPSPSISYVFTGVTNNSGSGTGSGSSFNKGLTNVLLTATNSCGTVTCTFTITVNEITIAGTVYDDGNGLLGTPLNTVDGNGTNATNTLYVNLVDGINTVVSSIPVASNGTYNFGCINGVNSNTTYNIILTNGSTATSTTLTTSSLPTNWVNTGENVGSGAGSDGTVNGKLSVNTNSGSVSNANFGINQLPNSDDKSPAIQTNPGGIVKVTVPNLTGSDPEDGTYNGTSITNTIKITSLATNGTLYYNNILVTLDQVITNYDPSLLTVDPNNGNVTVVFTYAERDAAGQYDPTPATVTMPYGDLTISGTVYDDANGGTINGTATNSIGANTIYANLVDPSTGFAIASVAVSGIGTYSFGNADGVTANTNFNVVISNGATTIGAAPVTTLVNAVNTAEELAGVNDGTANGITAANTLAVSIINVDFGINQLPNSDDKSPAIQTNPGGIVKVTVPTLTGSDPEDGTNNGTSLTNTIKITSLATNGTLYYNNILVTLNQVITNYDPSLLTVDPDNGNVTVVFTYAESDAAGQYDPTPATVTMPFGDLTISGTVYDDANGGTINGTATNSIGANTIYANLVDPSTGFAIASVAVSGIGTYSFGNADGVTANTNFNVVISNGATTIGAAPVTTLVNAVNTAEELAGVNDGTANGITAANTLAVSIINVDFGINQLPNSDDKSPAIQTNPGGIVKVTVPTLTGSDPEDGTYNGTSLTNTIKITSLATNGTLYYNNILVTLDQVITNYDPSLLTVDPNNGNVTVVFTYAERDAAGQYDPTPATVTMPYGDLTISGTVYDDANGGTINGTATNSIGANTIYANLVDPSTGFAIASVAVSGIGTYSFGNADGVTANTNFNVVISNGATTIGAAPVTTLVNAVNTAEELAGVNDGTANGITAANTLAVSIINVDFGINQLPNSDDKSPAIQTNPGGIVKVTVPTLTGSDPEDGTNNGTSLTNTIKITSLATNGTLYYNNILVTLNQVITNYDPSLLTVDPDNGNVTVVFTYAESDAAGQYDPTPATVTMPFGDLTISGTVYDDANGGTINGTATNSIGANTIYANLVDPSTGFAIASVAVSGSGTYSFGNADGVTANTNFNVVISNGATTIGAAPVTTLANAVNTAEELAGVNDGTANGITAANTLAVSIINVDFGINQLPNSDDKSPAIQTNPGGIVKVTVPTLTGSDPEDGTYNGTSLTNTIKITSLATNGTLYYNNILVTLDQVITNYDPSLLTVDPNNGNVTVVFTYAESDAAGQYDPTPATVTMPYGDLTISGTVYDDANGGTINGTATNSIGANTIYANLVDPSTGFAIASVAVSGIGTYSFGNADGVTANTNFNVVISNGATTIGAAPVTTLVNAVNTAEELAGVNDGTANGITAANTLAVSIINVDFGINQLPNSDDKSPAIQTNPGGIVKVTVPTLTGSDPEDGTYNGTSLTNTIKITSLATNGTLYYNNILVTLNQVITNYDPSLLTVDPDNGNVTVVFTYAESDAAGQYDPTPATVTMPFGDLTISGTVYDDANGGTINGTATNSIGANTIYANLVDPSTGFAIASVAVSGSGTYSFGNADGVTANTNFNVVISNGATTIGAAPVTTLANAVNTAEELAGVNDGTANGITAANTLAVSIINVDFGINQLPNSDDKSPAIQTNPGGIVKVTVPTLTGSDPEDGTYNGTSLTNTIKITSLATNGTLYYNNILVTLNQVITNYDPSLLTVDPDNGNVTVVFTYAESDAAGQYDPTPATVTMPYGDLTISGTVYDDANGGTINGTATNSIGANTIYANLVDPSTGFAIASVAVSGIGTYSFGNADGVTANTNFNVVISNGATTIGAAPVTTLANAVNTAEELAGVNDGTANGITAANTLAVSIINVDFGINQLPNSDDKSPAIQTNPGGIVKVTVPTLTGSDPEDGTYNGTSLTNTIKITSLATNGTLYYNNILVTLNQVITNYDPSLLTVDPDNGNVTVVFTYAESDAAGQYDPTPATVTMPFGDLTISGTVYDDANGGTINGTATNSIGANTIYANLVDPSTGFAIASVAVSGIGTYSFGNADGVTANTNFNVVISNGATTIGAAPVTTLVNAVNTAEELAGVNDGTANGITAANTLAVSIINVDFGINQLPNSDDKSPAIQTNPGGIVKVTVPTLTGSDPEDGTYNGTSLTNTIKITSLATNGTLYYNNILVTLNQVITNYDPSLLTVDPDNGNVTVVFTYAESDAAGQYDPTPATVTMPFGDLTISGTVYDDANGGTINGTATNSIGANTIYANLVDPSTGFAIASVAVSGSGTYSFGNADGVTANTNFNVVISNGATTIGAAPVTTLANAVNTAEELAGVNDGTANGITAANTLAVSIINVDFGINQLPNSDDKSPAIQTNPGGIVKVTVPTLTGSDPEDGTNNGTSLTNTIKITSLATNGTLYYNNILVTLNQVITNYDPSLLTVDPDNGNVTVVFTYAESDAAGQYDPTPATVTMPFGDLTISGTVYDDANGLYGTPLNTVDGSGTNASGAIYANLVNGTTVIASLAVSSGGSYSFGTANGLLVNTSYDIILTNGFTSTTTLSTSTLPTNWVSTGENLGAVAGNDGTVDGKLSVNTNSGSVINANFGLDQLPNSNNVTANFVNPGGTTTVTVTTLTGSDPEDGALGSGNTLVITSLATNGTLYYYGSAVVLNQVIDNYNPMWLSVDPDNCNVTVTFNYAFVDAANLQDLSPATATLYFTSELAPVIAGLPGPSTINCPSVPSFTPATVTDAHGNTFSLTFTDVTTSGACASQYSVTRTWTATDACNNTSTASQTIDVIDNVSPVITNCPSPQTFCSVSNNNYTIPVLSANDNCSNFTVYHSISGTTTKPLTIGNDASGNFNAGVSTISWIVTDACGNSTSCSTTVTINPLPTAIISGNNSPACWATNAEFSLSGTNNAVVTYSLNGGTTTATVTLSGGTATVTVAAATTNQTLSLINIANENCSQALTATSTVTLYQCTTPCNPNIHVTNNYDVDINSNNYTGSLRWALDRVCENGIIWFDIDCQSLTINLNPALGPLIVKKNVLFDFWNCQTCVSSGITINGSGTNLIINAGKVLTMSGCTKFTFKGCIQNNNGVNGLVLNSGASFIYDCCNLPATAKRDLTNVWHLFGSPFVKNSGATLGKLTPPSGSTQLKPYTNGYGWGTTTTSPLFQFTPLVGYAVKPSQSLTAALSGYLFCNSLAPNCDIFVNLVYTGTSALQSWNLLANPFPAYLNWKLLGKTNVNTTLYLWDNSLCPGCTPVTNGNYMRTYNAANNVGVPANTKPFIAPMQGFFVKANYTNPLLTFPLSARTHTTSPYYKEASTSVLVRLMTETDGTEDELVICKNDNSALGLERFDSEKLFTDLPVSMYSEAATGERLVINTINTTTNTIIPLGLKGEAGMKAKIRAFALESGEQVYLEDRLKGKLISLTENTTYEFEFPTENIQGRFFIRFGNIANPLAASDVKVFENNSELNIIAQTGENIQTVEVYSITGVCIFKATGNGNIFTKKLDLADGVYMVRVNTSLSTQNVKVNWR